MNRAKGLSTASTQLGLLGSVCLHLAITLWATVTPSSPPPTPVADREWPADAVQVESIVIGPSQAPVQSAQKETKPMLTGGLSPSSADTWQTGGLTGGADVVVNLGSRIGENAIRDVTRNNSALDQVQRINTAKERRSKQRVRQTPNPATDAVLSTGEGRSDARRAAKLKSKSEIDTQERSRNIERGVGAEEQRAQAAKHDRASTARVAASKTLRPDISKGRASTDTTWEAQTPADNINATSASRSAIDSSIEQTPSMPGQRGIGSGRTDQLPGARSLASSPVRGPIQGPVGNAAYDQWLAKQRKAIGDELRFPQRRKVSLDQGISIFELLVSRDGRVLRGPSLVRSSGFEDFDSEGRRAILATQLSPLPKSLTLGNRAVRVTMVVRFFNPMTF